MTPSVRLLRWWLLLSLAAGHLVTATEQKQEPTYLGVVRGDGILVPIAIYDGETWWNRWPWAAQSEEIRHLTVPATVREIPADWLPPGITLPIQWRVLPTTGRERPLRIVRPVRPPGDHLVDTIGFESDLPTGKVEDWVRTDVIGVAISGQGQLGRSVVPGRAEAVRLLNRFTPQADELERIETEKWWREQGRALPVRLVPDKRSPDSRLGALRAGSRPDGARYYQVRRDRVFRIPGETCGMHLSTDGIVIARPDGRIVSERLAAWAFGEYCGDAGEWTDLLAIVTRGGRVFWIVRISVEDGHDYGLLDPELPDPVVNLKGSWALRVSGEN